MNRMISKSTLALTLLAVLILAVAVPAHARSVNKSISIGDDETSRGASSVNCSFSVGDRAVVDGNLSTVIGLVRVGSDARVEDVSTVNGIFAH